jgi:hypothetical protein
MSENNATKETSSRKYLKEKNLDSDELRKKRDLLDHVTFDKVEEIRFKIELINYLAAELANVKAELYFLKQSRKQDS